MGKGKHGETCKQLVYSAIKQLGSPCDANKLVQAVKTNWDGKEDPIWQHLMSLVVNLPPARHHWSKIRDRFLFLREDGQYELYNAAKHGIYDEEGTRLVSS